MVLNALDDFLCLKENIRTDVNEDAQYYILKLTEHGRHAAFNEGIFIQRNFIWKLTLDLLSTEIFELPFQSILGDSNTCCFRKGGLSYVLIQ